MIERDREKETDRQTYRQRQTDKQSDRQRQTDMQTDRQRGKTTRYQGEKLMKETKSERGKLEER